MNVLIRQHVGVVHVREGGDGRTLIGPVMPWGVEAVVYDRGRQVVETFERGALAGVVPGRVPLTARHPRDAEQLPIGVTTEIEERADAAWGAWHVSRTALGDEVLALAQDQVPLGLSVGFMEVPGGSRWSPDRRRVTRIRATLDHIAVVRQPAYAGAAVAGIRMAGEASGAGFRSPPWPAAGGSHGQQEPLPGRPRQRAHPPVQLPHLPPPRLLRRPLPRLPA